MTNPVQYGSQVKRLSVYLRNEQFIPYERERQMLADLFELPNSTGSLQNFLETAAENVKPATEAIKKAEVGHADETGFYINGKRCWLYTVRTYISTIRKQGLNVWEALGSLFDDDILMPQLIPV